MQNAFEDNEQKRRVAIYIRVSTEEQKIDGYGLEAQQRRLTDYVNNNQGLNLETKKDWLYTDTHTGSDLNRSGLTQLLDDVRKGKFDAVLVWKIDRLSRNLQHLLNVFDTLEKNNVSFISVQENIDFKGPIGKLIFQIFGAIAQFERELIKGRTQMGKIASAQAGNYTGTTVPYAYKKVPSQRGKGHVLEIIPDEKKWVEQIYEWCIYEDLGEGQIAKRLNDLKVPKKNHEQTSRASKNWTHIMVRTILTNPLYRGQFIANKKDEAGALLPEDKWTVVEIPACISAFTFLQAQEARRRHTGGTPATDYLLTGKLVDMNLERPKRFVGAKRFKGGFSYRRKQFAKGGHHYPVFEIPGKQMEDYIWGKVREALKEPEIFIKKYLSKHYANPTRIKRLQQELATLRSSRANAELAIARIEEAYEAGRYSQEKMAEKTTERNAETTAIDLKIIDIEDQLSVMSSAEIEVQKLRGASEQVKYRLDNLDPKQKKILCNLFIDRIEMRRKKVHSRWMVTADVFFRFNPQKFSEDIEGGRTMKRHVPAERGQLEKKFGVDGGR